jgi:hypothetical protein
MKNAVHFGRFVTLAIALAFSQVTVAQTAPNLTGQTANQLPPGTAGGGAGPDLTGNSSNAMFTKPNVAPEFAARMPLGPPAGSTPISDSTGPGFNPTIGFGLLALVGIATLGIATYLKKSK